MTAFMPVATFKRELDGANLVKKFKDVLEVQEVLRLNDGKPKGKVALLNFLENWNTEHSM
jgi:hypothetical protein